MCIRDRIETVYGEDVPFQIAEFTRLSGVSKIVIGRSSATKRHLLSKPTLTEKLIDYAPNLVSYTHLDVYKRQVPKRKRI